MYILALVATILLIILDKFTKVMAVDKLQPINSTSFIDGIINFTYVENAGAAFGILQGARWIFLFLTIPVLLLIIYYFIKMPKNKVAIWMRISLVLIFAGAFGNMIDRLMKGYVVDFLEFAFIDFPVFNLADIYIVTGTIMLGIIVIFFIDDNKKTKDTE